MRVLVAESHPSIRAGIRALLRDVCSVNDVLEAANARALQQRMLEHPDLVLLDYTMSGLSRTKPLLRIRQQDPDIPIVILTTRTDEQTARQALESGANGVLVKADLLTDLRHALKGASDRRRPYISPSVRMTGSLVHAFPREELTPRQREILELIARGLTSRRIAATLGLHIKTVESHRTDLMRRLEIHNVAGLVRYALRHGLLPPHGE
jgi:DNA-binding NarL/FixJ family response regulator